MRTKLPVLCILFFGVFAAFAQPPASNLVAFTDYAKCTHGLKDRHGKQVWKSEFTSLEVTQLKIERETSKYFWIAEKNGLYGALNDSGVIVLPFRFEKLELNKFSNFIGYKPGVIEVYALSGEKKYAGTGLDEIEAVSNGFIITQNRQKGFLDLRFQERLPISFSSINPAGLYQHLDSHMSEPSSHLLEVSKGDQQGVYDLNRHMVIPCKYKELNIHWVDQYCKESEAVYSVFQNDMRFAFDSKGNLIDSMPSKQELEFYLIPIDSCSSNAYLLAFVSVRDSHGKILKTRIINIQTGEKSKFYDAAIGNGNRILCKEGKKWFVLDEHFKELGQWTKWNASWEYFIRESFDIRDYRHVYRYVEGRPRFSRNVHYNNQLVGIYSKETKQSKYLKLGLYHYELDKYIPPEYFQINTLEFEGKPIYWAYKISKKDIDYEYSEIGPEYTQIDIYDDQLNKLKSFNKSEFLHFENIEDKDVSNKLFFQSSGKKYGAVNAIGEQLIPIKYKEYGTLYSGMGEVFYLFGSGYYLGVFDHTGKQLIPENHMQYRGLETVFLATNPDGTYSVYRKNGDQLLSNVSTYFIAKERFQTPSCSYIKGDKKSSRNLIFFVQGEQLFYVQGEDFSLVDSETFEFGSTYLRLSATIIIDQNAKVVDTKGLRLSKWYSKCPMELENIPIHQESIPVQKNEEALTKLNYKWEQKYDYKTRIETWILKDLSGRKLSSREFDYPFDPLNHVGKIFRVNNKYGLMTEVFREVLPPEYKYIFPVSGGFIVHKDSLWRCYDFKSQRFSPDAYDVVSLHVWSGKRFVFKNGKVGILTDSLTYLIPLTDSLEFVKQVDLIKVLQLEKQSKFDLNSSYHLIVDGKPAQVYKMLNNGQLIWYAYQRSTANSVMEISPIDGKFLKYQPRISFRYYETITEKTPQVKTSFYYTEEVESHLRMMDNYFDIPSYSAYEREFRNYKIVGERLIPIHLKDIIPNELAMKKLDDLLTEELNKKQYFGQNCTDIAAKIERLKNNVLITGNTLKFHWPDSPKFEFELSFNQLNGILPKELQRQVSEF